MNAIKTAALHAVAFGSPQRQLFGLFHSPSLQNSGLPAVVIGGAFGQEGIRAHRMLRVLAERLARQGHAVLRFDAFGTGDSMGEDEDLDMEGWAADVITADTQVRLLSGAHITVWMGMRLGASAMLRAAQVPPPGLTRLVLWDPVIDGSRYLELQRANHVISLERAFSLMPNPAPRDLARDLKNFRDEAIGFAVSPRFREQLDAMCFSTLGWPQAPLQVEMIVDPGDPDAREISQKQLPLNVHIAEVAHGTDWTTDSAENTTLVPPKPLMALVERIGASA